jgi:hypothetical protein
MRGEKEQPMPPIKRLLSLALATALVILGIVDVVYLGFFAKEVTLSLIASAALTLGLGGFWLYSELSSAPPAQEK